MILFLVLDVVSFTYTVFFSVCLAIIVKLGDHTVATCIPVTYHSIIDYIFFISLSYD